MVHELYAALHRVHIFIEHGGVDDVENVGMRLILGVENGHDIPARHLQTKVQPVRFAYRIIVVNEQLHIGIAQLIDLGLRLGNGSRVILAAYRYDLHEFAGIVKIIHLLNGLTVHIFFVLGGQENSKGKTRIALNGRSAIQPSMFRHLPDIETLADIKDSLKDHHQDDVHKDVFKQKPNIGQHHKCSL